MLSQRLPRLVLLVFLLLPRQAWCSQAGKGLTLAVLPCYDAFATFKKFNRLAQYLKKQTGLPVDIVISKDLESTRSSLQSGEIDFVLQDPHTYVELAANLRRDFLLSTLARDGTGFQRGLVIVRKDGGVRKLADLHGKRVLFGPKLSITRWAGARELFQQNGIDIDRDLKSYSQDGCCEDVAFNVFLQAVDAGVVCDDYFSEHGGKNSELGIDLDRLAVIGKTRPFPTRVLAARRGIDEKVLAQVSRALLALDIRNPEGEKILAPAGLGGFQRSEDKDFTNIRTLMGKTPP